MNLSYWQREHSIKFDYVIVGGGIVGLTSAIFTKRQNPKARVLVLEQGTIPQGATTNNAGFACIGSLGEILASFKTLGIQDTLEQVKNRYSGLQELRALIGEKDIEYKAGGNYEVLTENQLDVLDSLEVVNGLLEEDNLPNTFSMCNKDLGFSDRVKAVIHNQYEGELNSGKLHRALLDLAMEAGVEFRFGTKVLSIGDEINTEQYSFKYGKVAVCANAYTSMILPEYNIKPARGQVIIYKGLDLKELDLPCHHNQGYNYFRKIDDHRLLIGGGRNENFLAEQTTHLTNTKEIKKYLKDVVAELFGRGINDVVEYSWSGLMGFSNTLKPIVEVVPNRKNVVIGFGCNGIGVALGTSVGKKVAELLCQ